MSPHRPPESQFEEASRALKVERLTSYLEPLIDLAASDAGELIDNLADQDESWWKAVAIHCSRQIGHKVNPPSAISIEHIQAELRKRIPDDSDPFDLAHPSREIPTVELHPDPDKVRESIRNITEART